MTTTATVGATKTTLRDLAIAYREADVLRQVSARDNARSDMGDDGMTAAEKRDLATYWIKRLNAEIATLRAMPVDVADADVRAAMDAAHEAALAADRAARGEVWS